jgi:pimeloyl-ACP methyl ester carboxylesterase
MPAPKVPYDEFSMFHENAEEFGIAFQPPTVERRSVDLGDGRRLSALIWGTGQPDLVFLHGGAQNAHTWDTVLLALDRPAVAIDLPGHGHSDGGRSGYLNPDDNADDVALAIQALAPNAKAVVGMSLGGITTIALADRHPALVRKVVLVDITPGVNREKSSQITAFVNGPESFPDFDASLRRGILHNAVQRDDGTWVWRYARHRLAAEGDAGPALDPHEQFHRLWEAVSAIQVPVMLVRGMRPQSVVDDADETELLRRLPETRIEHLEEAGHSVQGDMPVELAALIADFVP